ncbi:ArsR/SmtB family transcription factor [Amycolatopsis anabasis]|uniref:ArsR/SmtB family transcription factor n=1 Tax=Amycolatopsis anabasis TaxID=1840409 RepID=UPI00131D9FE5|nr:metalloregulator ArsR/SmtB family transcription factor [Amycolatopsis anabasis]
MRALNHPELGSVELATVLNALADPLRLRVVGQLAEAGGVVCGAFDVPVSMSTLSHHLKVLREAGLLRVIPQGSFRRHELRLDEVENRFPGVLRSVIDCVEDDQCSLGELAPRSRRQGAP